MSDQTKLQQIAQALKEADIDQGHTTREQAEMQWGRYEMLARTAVEGMQLPTISAIRRNGLLGYQDLLKSILEGKS